MLTLAFTFNEIWTNVVPSLVCSPSTHDNLNTIAIHTHEAKKNLSYFPSVALFKICKDAVTLCFIISSTICSFNCISSSPLLHNLIKVSSKLVYSSKFTQLKKAAMQTRGGFYPCVSPGYAEHLLYLGIV